MNTKQLISKFISQICEKQFAYANSTLSSIVEAKMKEKIKKQASKMEKKVKKTHKKPVSKHK